MRRVLLFLLILTATSANSYAGTKTWNNASGGNWSVGANWLEGSAPVAGDDIIITFDGDYTVTYDVVSLSVSSITIGGASGTQTLSHGTGRAITITGSLTINANGVFHMTGGTYSAVSVINNGTVRFTGTTYSFSPPITNNDSLLIGGTTITLSGNLTNLSNVYITTGTLSLTGGSSSASGNFFVSSGSSVSFNTGTHILDASSSISGAGNVTFSSTTTTLSGSFNITGTTVNSAGTTTFNGAPGTLVSIADSLHMSGGTLNLITGDSIIVPKIRMNSGTTVLLVNAPIRFIKSFTHNAGTVRGNGGSGIILVSPGLVYDIPTTSTTKWQKLTVLNEGTIQWSGSFSITLDSGVVINNYGLFNPLSTGTVTLNHSSGTMAQFNNYGTYRRSVGTTVSNINALFNGFSGSVVDVQSGTLAFNQNSVFNDADASVSSGALLQINDTSSWNAASSISGAGNVEFSSLVTMSGSYNIGGYTSATGGTTTFDGTSGSLVSIGDSLYMGAGTLRLFTSDSVIVGAVRMNSLSGVLSLNALLRFTRTFTHNAGTLNGLDPSVTVIVSPGLTYNAATTSTTRWRRMTLLNQGTVQWTGSFSITLDSGVVINNYGLFNPQSTGTVTLNYGVGAMAQFNNYGTYRRSVGTTVSNINALFNGYSGSLIEIQSGTLAFNQNSVFTDADASVSSGALLQINDTSSWDAASSISGSGNVQFDASSTVSGGYTIAGTTSNTAGSTTFNNGTGLVGIFDSVYVSSGTLTFSTVDTVRINRLQLSGGTLTGSAPVWINTVWNWIGGTASGTDSTITTVISPGAVLNVSTGSTKTMSRRTVVNYGTMIHTGTSFTYTNGAVFDNKSPGVIDLAGSNSGFSYSAGTSKPRIKNSGLLKKSAGTASTIAIVVENTDGRIEVQTTSLTLSDTTKWTNSVDTVFAGATMIFSGGTATKHVFDSGSRLAGYGNVTFSNGTATLSGTYDILGVSTFTGDTVKLNGAGGSIQSLGDSISVTAGTVTITTPDNIQIRALRQSAGTFNANMNDSLLIDKLILTGGTLTGNSPMRITDNFNWSGGVLEATDSTVTTLLPSGVTFAINGGFVYLSKRTLTTYANTDWNTGVIRMINGSAWNNQAGSLFDIKANNYMEFSSSSTFNNYGTFRKSGGTGTSFTDAFFNNYSGLVEIKTGTFEIRTSSNAQNTLFSIDSAATMIFTNAGAGLTHSVDSVSAIKGNGILRIASGTNSFRDTIDIRGETFITGGTSTFSAPLGTLVKFGKKLTVNGTAYFIRDTLKIDSLVTTGTLGGTAPIYVNSKFVLNGGTVVSTDSSTTITIPVGATFYWSGNGTFQRRTFNNYGTAIWTSPWGLDMNAVYNNMPGALTDWTVDGNTNWFGGTSNNFNNYGTLRKSGGTGISSFEYYVNNYGLIEVQSGTLYFGASGSHAGGDFVLSPGSTIDFAAGNHTFDTSSNVTGTGTVLISPTTFAMDGIYNIIGNTTIGGGTINFDSTFSTTNRTTINGGTTNFRMMPGHFLGAGNRLNVASGTVNFVTTDSLKVDTLLVNGTVNGNNHWYVRNYLQLTAGTMASPNRALSLTLPAGSTFNWSGNGTVSQRTVFNYGTANWSSPWGFSDSTVYNNMAGAVTNLTTDYNSNWFFATGEPYLVNYGTLNKSGGTGISSFEYQISNYGTMQVDSGLTILCYDSLVNFSGGIITGKGTLDVSTRFTNSGMIRPGTSPGKLRVTGNLKNTSTAIYDAEIGGKNLGQFDELRASGSATLAGILNVNLINGYLPALNDTVKVLNYSSKTGAFGEINGLRTGGPYDFVPLYKDTALFLIASDSLNSEPIASTDFLSAPEDVETHLPVLRNDVDSNSDALSIVEILPGYPQNGTAYIGSPDTTIVYTSPLNYFGKDTLRYVIYDGRGGWDTAGVSITVTPVNDAPSPKDTFAIADQFGIARINVIATATDVEGSSLFASTASKPKYGEAHVDGNDSFVVYVPPVYFTGVDSFKFYVSDGGAVDSATIVVTVTAGDSFLVTRSNFNTNDEGWNTFNDVSDSAFLSTGGNPGGFFYAVDAVTGAWWYFNAPSKFLGDLSSTYNKTLRFDMKQKPAGTDNSQPDVILIGNGVQLNYDFPSNPRTNFTGFGLILNETTGWKKQTTGLAPSQLEMQTVLANVTTLRIRGEFTAGADSAGIDNIILAKIPDNSSPVANTDNASTNEEVSLQVSPLTNDTDAESQSLTITAVGNALNGTATIDVGNLTITYKPDSNFAGLDSFAYYITDGYGGQDSAYIRVTVNNINDAPVVVSALRDTSFSEDFPKTFIRLLSNVFTDVDNAMSFGAVNLSAGVTPFISNDSLYLLSSALLAGNGDIRITAFDGEYTVADTFTVTVSSVNQAPVVAIPFRDTTLAEDFAKTFLSRLTQNFTDPNLDTLFFNVSSSSGNVIPSLQNDSLYLTGLANFNGTVAIYVGATDGSQSVADTFLVHVATQNDAASSFVLLIPAHNTLTNILRPAFKWNASHDIDGDTVYYHLEISTLQNFSSIFQSYTIIDTFQTLTSDLDSLGIYYWRVTADDHKGGAFQSSSFTLNVDAKRPNVHISLLQGTITKRYLDAYAYADEDLSGTVNSTFTLKNSSGTTIDNRSAAMSKIGTSNLYTSSYHLTNVGSLEVQVTAQDAAANQRIATRNYTVSALLKGETFVSLSPEFEVSSIKPALSESGFLLTGSITEIESTLMPSLNAGVELIGTTELKDALKLTIRYDASEMSSLMLRSDFDERKIGVYRVTEFGFEYAGGQGRLCSVSTTVNSFGKYVALYDQNHAVIPEKIELSQNYPNPFNPTTTIQYGLATAGKVKLVIYNILGQRIRELVDANHPAGYYKILWDGRNAAGQTVATGIYFYRLETQTGTLSRKMLLIK